MSDKRNSLDLSIYGISDVKQIYHNLSYDELFKHETDPSLEGYERGYWHFHGQIPKR